MKYLYVLVHSETGYYLEQTYISMLSLKHVMPNASITLIVDDVTDKITNNTFLSLIKTLISEYKVIPLPTDMSATAKSRHIKTSMRQHIDGDFLYIDSDTIWASPINEKDFTFDIMGVLDGHTLFTENQAKKQIENDFKTTKCFVNSEYYINGGVLYSQDTDFSKTFFRHWHAKWRETSQSGLFVDQPALNYTLNQMSTPDKFLLPGEYNAQISNSWNFFFKSKIIHYFSFWISSPNFKSAYIPQSTNFWKKIKESGMTEEIYEIIHSPVTAFEKNITIKPLEDEGIKKTALYGLIKDLYDKRKLGKKSKFDFFERIIRTISNKNIF